MSRGCWDRARCTDAPRGRNGAVAAHRPWPRAVVTADAWQSAVGQLRDGGLVLVGLWGDVRSVHMALRDRAVQRDRRAEPRLSGAAISVGWAAAPARDPAGACGSRSPRLANRRSARHTALARTIPPGPLTAFLPARRRGLHQIPVGPVHAGIIEPGHFRFTANGEDRGAARRAARLCAQGRRGADGRRRSRRARPSSPGASRATARSPMPSPSRAPRRRRWMSSRRCARSGCAR